MGVAVFPLNITGFNGARDIKRNRSHTGISKEGKKEGQKESLLCYFYLISSKPVSNLGRADRGSVRMGGTYLLWNMMECLPSCFPWESKCSCSHIPFHSSGLLKNVASVIGGQTACVAPFGSNGLRLWPAILTLLGKRAGRHTPFLSLWELISFQYLLEKCLMGWAVEENLS